MLRVFGYVCGLKMMHRRQASNTGLSWFKFPRLPAPEEENLSFMEKWRKHMDRKKKEANDFIQVIFMRGLMLFQAPTQIYAFMYYIIPHIFEDYSPWTIYYMKVLAWFVLLNGLTNWLCVILYDPQYPKTKDNPFLQVNQQYDTLPDHFIAPIEQATSNQNQLNGHCVYDMTSKEALPWNFCKECQMHVPPRTHHCKFCKTCILKRDHHCFMVGNCIGFKNQRYFIVLAFYAMITGVLGGYFTFKYVRNVIWPSLDSWSDMFFPITIFRCLFGDIKGINCLLIVHLYLEFFFGVIGFVYFTSQMTISANGKTLFEVAKKVPIKNMNSINRNLKSVFGDFWVLNFLFPMTLIFRQRDDGIHWDGVKIDHNANEKWEDDGEVI
ncbi:uncharacterized protein LOC132730338 isoform X2 [Ruditapes philippinarum]|uniref:uncharacterized protein LOC132730338 isoform X2 n=1 Tax=Ruditapes philippinarum TaxID=129788 RepID=UPI00295BFD38|nr:uncharacterized protein LOC132730338 isoform X2 [Ruditapes philippinarum]